MSSIIHASHRSRLITSASTADAAQAEAESCIAQAREQARAIVAEARASAEEICAAAMDDGRRLAEHELQQQVDRQVAERVAPAIDALAEGVAKIEHSHGAYLAHWEKRVVELASAMAGRIVRRQLIAEPEIPLDLVREALHLAVSIDGLRVLLNPADLKVLGTSVKALAAGKSIEVVADPSVTRGGCMVVSRYGSIDQRIETQLARLLEELT